jgi:enterochelin esterase-like enzyme
MEASFRQTISDWMRWGRPGRQEVAVQTLYIESRFLERVVQFDLYLPPNFGRPKRVYPVIFFNDGQDLPAVGLKSTLEILYRQRRILEVVAVGIHCGEARMEEYGTAGIEDYQGRGSKAAAYTLFVVEELIPELKVHFPVAWRRRMAFAGFSLGGLSAFDIVWSYPEVFERVGVFSGSFWWRYAPYQEIDPDAGRVMQDVIRYSQGKSGLKFWFQTGTNDETDDRNFNGVIDTIDDTIDVILELEQHGFRMDLDIRYVEVPGGEHNQDTWGEVMPDFLIWAYGRRKWYMPFGRQVSRKGKIG